jgi:hypothetical protein
MTPKGRVLAAQAGETMSLRTRLTERFRIEHRIFSAPMGFIAAGEISFGR